MKRVIQLTATIFVMAMTINAAAHDHNKSEKYSLKGSNISVEGELLDNQYRNITNRMGEIIARYNLLNNKEIKTVPYQVDYSLGKDYIKMEKHAILRSSFDNRKILSLLKKSIKIYTDGSKIKKIETSLYKKNYRTGSETRVILVDSTPTSGGTGDILISQIKDGRWIIKEKALEKFRNTTAYPVRNDVKRNFLVEHMTMFNDYLIFIGETHDRKIRKHDSEIASFLKTSTKY